MARNRGPARPIQCHEEGALADDCKPCWLIVEPGEVLRRSLVARAAGDADGALGDRGEHLLLREDARDGVRHVEALEARERKEGRVHSALVELPQPSLHVPAEVHDLEVRVLGEDLALPAQRGAPDHCALGELGQRLVLPGHKNIACVLAREVAGQDSALGEVCWHVLHGVHGDVDPAVEQGIVNLLGEEPLASNVRERLVKNLVPCRLDNFDLERTILIELREVFLQEVPC
mmetsp:Transcript_33342/g.79061  ORF Transcript_33342/g.79061 Transcript_33342/m.79061 type:complete len:232 (+) Transcript_33342:333-1028(+)